MQDIQWLENKARKDQERIKNAPKWLNTSKNSEGTNGTKYLDEKPINAEYWNNLSIQETEAQYDHLINPK